MSKKLLLLVISFVLLFNVAVLAGDINAEYETLQKELETKFQSVKSREAYQTFMKERKTALEAFLKKVESAKASDETAMVHGKLLFALRNKEEALKKFENLIAKKSPLADAAKFEKIKVLQSMDQNAKALVVFDEVKAKVKKDKDYYGVVANFAFTAKDEKRRLDFSKEFITDAPDSPEMANMKGYMYDNLANAEKDKGNIKKAIEILEKAIAAMKDPRAKQSLESSLGHLKRIGQPAPAIAAQNWENSSALELAKLKGKAVILDFWAPWCPPCRKVIPTLKKSYAELKDKGLVVIGFTKLYGRYSDDKQNKGQVPPEEEKKLINGFLKTNEIAYPIAIAEDDNSFKAYGVRGIPTMVLIDKNGNIADIHVGSGDEEHLAKKIKELLK